LEVVLLVLLLQFCYFFEKNVSLGDNLITVYFILKKQYQTTSTAPCGGCGSRSRPARQPPTRTQPTFFQKNIEMIIHFV
jgi:hypothetical protein